jgi:MFS family permease
MLILCSSLADCLGPSPIYLAGVILQAGFTLGTALSRTASQLLAFRALAGLVQAMILPSAVSLVIDTCPDGQIRNIAFDSIGSSQPLGFSTDLIIAGVVSESLGWRFGFYVASGVCLGVVILGFSAIPMPSSSQKSSRLQTITGSVDWLGTLLISLSMGCVSYVLM